jgi:hypothetical protein
MSWYRKAKEEAVLPEFDPSPEWERLASGEGRIVTATAKDSYEAALEEVAEFSGDPMSLFTERNPGKNMAGFDSLYVDPSGRIHLIRQHSHDEVAGKIMRRMNPEAVPPGNPRSKGGGWRPHDFAVASGIQRFQIYGDGMGVTIDMNRPSNRAQLDAIREAFSFTPMKRFVAEITLDGKILNHLTSFKDLVHFVNNWNLHPPKDP